MFYIYVKCFLPVSNRAERLECRNDTIRYPQVPCFEPNLQLSQELLSSGPLHDTKPAKSGRSDQHGARQSASPYGLPKHSFWVYPTTLGRITIFITQRYFPSRVCTLARLTGGVVATRPHRRRRGSHLRPRMISRRCCFPKAPVDIIALKSGRIGGASVCVPVGKLAELQTKLGQVISTLKAN
jgi:hypothetical protein